MTSKQQFDLFSKYFDQLAAQRGAFSVQDKLALQRELRREAAAQGTVPISLTQLARVQVSDPRLQAILDGQEVSLGGVMVGRGPTTARQRLAGMGNGQKILALLAVALLPLALFAAFLLVRERSAAPLPPTPPTAGSPTTPPSAAPTLTPAAALPATPYALVLNNEDAQVARGPNDPVSVEFGGVAFELTRSKLVDGEWHPVLAEWLEGSQVRRVVAVPFSQEVGQAVARLRYGDLLRLRLGSSQVVEYRLVDIARLKRHQIEVLSSSSPSLALLLHSERASERYVLIGEALQPCPGDCPPTAAPAQPAGPPAPTLPPTPEPTPTPRLEFTPPLPVTVIVTDTRTVVNRAAGLQLTVLACSRVAQIGYRQGHFMLCEVALTALESQAAYSGGSLAITEFAQASQTADWWPPTVSVAGMLGDGSLSQGQSIQGKVAGEVARQGSGLKSTSDPVLLWEQAGLRFVIYLEH